ncbi:hypothetical protein AYO38_05550 [bacterium SCGC AG-212-C10]|nr:hypothetical protein AYO38_05550 [bacterium SCGC AG-212-C10]
MSVAAGGSRSPFSVLQNAQFRLLFIGNTLAMMGFGMMNVVQGVVAFDLTGRNSAVGFIALGQGLAMVFLSPLGGALSDRLSKRKLLTFTQASIGLMFALIAVLIYTDAITIGILFACTLVLGCMFALMGPTRQAWIGDLLNGEELVHGVALQQLSMNSTRIVGPLLAGVLLAIAFFGSGGVYAAMAITFALVVGVLFLMQPTPPTPKAGSTSVFGDLLAGGHYIWNTSEVRLLTLVFAGIVLSGFSYQTLLPGFLENELGHPASHLGFLFGTTAIGGIITTVFISLRRPAKSVFIMLCCGGALALSLLALALSPTFEAALAVCAIIGASSSGFQMLNNVNLMQRTSPQFFGRVMAVTMMAFGLNNIVSYPVGALADHIGERNAMASMATICMAIVICGMIASTRVVYGATAVPVER